MKRKFDNSDYSSFSSVSARRRRRHNSSFSSVSVRCRRAFSFKRRLTDTYDLGKNPPGADFRVARRARIRDDTRNLPKTGTGFVGIHGSLREIPEGDEKYSRWRSLFFYHSRMTGMYNSSFSSVSVRCRRAFSFKRRLTDTCVLGNLPKTGTDFVENHASLREIPEAKKIWSLTLPIFYRSRMTGSWYFSTIQE